MCAYEYDKCHLQREGNLNFVPQMVGQTGDMYADTKSYLKDYLQMIHSTAVESVEKNNARLMSRYHQWIFRVCKQIFLLCIVLQS